MKSIILSTLINALSFGHVKYGWYNNAYVSQQQPIFVGGCSRSGTTLLYSIINSHSQISLGLETGLLTGKCSIMDLANRTKLPVKRLTGLHHYSRCYPEFAENVLRELAKRDDKPYWGDKSPVNVILVEDIFQHFPKARFIHCIRDGRDVSCSLRGNPPSFGNKYDKNPWSMCVDRWNSWTRHGMKFRGDPRYFEIKYEDLTGRPDQVLQNLFKWLEVSWEPAILEKARMTQVTSHPELSHPINKNKIARWRSNMPIEARELFHGQPNDLLIELGYTNNEDWIKDHLVAQTVC